MENIMKYSWMSAGCRSPRGWFATKEMAYTDMQSSALDYIKQECMQDIVGDAREEVSIRFADEQIVAKIGQMERSWEIVAEVAIVHYLGDDWETIDEEKHPAYDKESEDWWFVSIIPDEDGTFADLWMDNNLGRMVLIRPNGQMLLRYF